MNKQNLTLALVVLTFLASIASYNYLPEKVASHWGISGEADGYSSKEFGIFVLPVILAVLYIIFQYLPKIDPTKNIYKFKEKYYEFVLVLFIFMSVIHFQIIGWNLGYMISPSATIPLMIGFLFFYLGGVLEKSKRNYFIGIRTPWTLSNDKVWEKTHNIGGKLFRIIGLISILGIFFTEYYIYVTLIPIVFVVVFCFLYSYYSYKKIKAK